MARFIEIQRTDRVGPSRVTINNNFQELESLINEKIHGLDWQESVLSFIDEASAVENPRNRYIADSDGATWQKDHIYQWGLPPGASSSVSYEWLEIIPDDGTALLVEDEDRLYMYNGTAWVKLSQAVAHNDLSGIQGGNATERYHLTNSQHTTLTGNLDAQSLHYHDLQVSPPADNFSSGVKGQWAVDDNYYYYCVATNTWVRQPVETEFFADEYTLYGFGEEASSSSSP